MSTPVAASLLALTTAFLISLLELVTSEYPQTSALLLRQSFKPYLYGGIYGAIAFALTASLGYLAGEGSVSLTGLGLQSPWLRAVAVGVTIKAFMHVRLFTVGIRGSSKFPVGVETLVQLFEPWLLRGIEIDHFNAVRGYIAPRADKYPNLQVVKDTIKNNLPTRLSSAELTGFRADVDKAASVLEAMEQYLAFLGSATFNRVFPL